VRINEKRGASRHPFFYALFFYALFFYALFFYAMILKSHEFGSHARQPSHAQTILLGVNRITLVSNSSPTIPLR